MKPDEALAIKNTAVAALAQALASPVRLQMLGVLEQAEHSVDALAAKIAQSRANTSAQLKVLQAAGVVESRRDGRRVLYRLASDAVRKLFRTLQSTAAQQDARMRELIHSYYQTPDLLNRTSARALLSQVRSGEVVLLDLRPADEYESSHAAFALNVPIEELEQRLDEIPKHREVVVYCRGRLCVLAVEGVRKLRARGRSARNLGASVRDLGELGVPLVKA